DLAALEQEKLDEKMLNTGTVPVSDSLTRMPAAADGPLKGKSKAQAVEEDDEEEELRQLQKEMAM
ncbi:MAG: hypothetical protein Q9192_003124, partial [Flavoplaca navasiana]